MTGVRASLIAMAATLALIVSGCSSDAGTRVTVPPPAPAPTALPTGWSESQIEVPGAGSAVYTAPASASRLQAALIVPGPGTTGPGTTGPGTTGTVGPALSVLLAHAGIASVRPAPSTASYQQRLLAARAALADLAARPAVGPDRVLVVGYGDGAPLALDLSAGTAPAVHGFALLEPVFGGEGAPAPGRLVAAVPPGKHVLITCSDSDPAVNCTDLQHLVDVMSGTHVNYVRLTGVGPDLREVTGPDLREVTGPDLREVTGTAAPSAAPVSALLNQALGSWASMQ